MNMRLHYYFAKCNWPTYTFLRAHFRYSAWHVFSVRLQHCSTQPTSEGNFGFVVCRSGVQLTLLCLHKVFTWLALSPPGVYVVNIGGDYKIGRSVCPSVCPSFRVCTRWLRKLLSHVNTSTFYSSNVVVITLLGGDMHSHERLLFLLRACFITIKWAA